MWLTRPYYPDWFVSLSYFLHNSMQIVSSYLSDHNGVSLVKVKFLLYELFKLSSRKIYIEARSILPILTLSSSGRRKMFLALRNECGRKKYNRKPIAIHNIEYIMRLFSKAPLFSPIRILAVIMNIMLIRLLPN